MTVVTNISNKDFLLPSKTGHIIYPVWSRTRGCTTLLLTGTGRLCFCVRAFRLVSSPYRSLRTDVTNTTNLVAKDGRRTEIASYDCAGELVHHGVSKEGNRSWIHRNEPDWNLGTFVAHSDSIGVTYQRRALNQSSLLMRKSGPSCQTAMSMDISALPPRRRKLNRVLRGGAPVLNVVLHGNARFEEPHIHISCS